MVGDAVESETSSSSGSKSRKCAYSNQLFLKPSDCKPFFKIRYNLLVYPTNFAGIIFYLEQTYHNTFETMCCVSSDDLPLQCRRSSDRTSIIGSRDCS